MKALITGADGQLARELILAAPSGIELKTVHRSECDITDRRAVERAFDSFRPNVVINTAAYTAVDAAEDARDLAFLVNAQGAENVARAADLAGARVIHISTDYVFDGNRSSPYPPDARPNPLNAYGQSKLEGERLVLAGAASALVIRTGWLYSRVGKNFLNSILRALNTGKPLRVVQDQVGGPTSAAEFATAIWGASEAELRGVRHWSNTGTASWYDFAVEIAKLALQLGVRSEVPEVVGISTEEFGSCAKRPRYSVLDSSLLTRELKISPAPWQDALSKEMRRPAPVE